MFSRRKWGWYLVIWRWSGIKIKLLFFKTNGSISLQRHFFRSEDWYLLYGRGMLELGHSQIMLSKHGMRKGGGAFIPVKLWHRFTANVSTLVLEIQRGQCSEKDIERA